MIETIQTASNGRFEFDLNLDTIYEVRFIKDGFVTKKIGFDTRSVPEEDRKFGDYSISKFRVKMVPKYDDIDYAVMQNQAGRYVYSELDGSFVPDERYAKRMKHTFSTIEKKIEKKKHEQLLLEKEFNDEYQLAIKDADLFYDEKDYESAYWQYQAASELKPSESYPHEQMVKVEKKLNANKDKEETYIKLMEEGNDLVREGAYRGAIAKFDEALDVKPKEEYPTERIAYCEEQLELLRNAENSELLAEQERLKKLKEFNDLLAEGKDYAESQMYLIAEGKFSEASNILPERPEPAEEIAKIQTLIDQQNAEFTNLIEGAKSSLDEKDFSKAQGNIAAALRIKPEDQSAKDLSVAIDKAAYEEQQRLEQIALKGANDTAFNKQLAEDYPEGRSEDVKSYPDRSTITIVIVADGRGDMYVLEDYKNGEDYYFKNKKPYAKKKWLEESGYQAK